VEVRTADLGISVEEAAALLGAGMGLRLEREQVAALVESLTEQELEVLRLLAARRSNAGIAAELVVEQSTSRRTSSMCTASWASTAVPRRWPAPARCGCSTDPGRRFHLCSPPSGGRAPPATPPS
jgi:FixJ family two-component response regulator